MRDLTLAERDTLDFDEGGRYIEATVEELAAAEIGGCCAGPSLFKDILKFGHGNRLVRGVLTDENALTGLMAIEGLSEEEGLNLEDALSSTESYLRFDSSHQGWSIWEDE